jgi:tetratricopeptide (TPR) repeat protein
MLDNELISRNGRYVPAAGLLILQLLTVGAICGAASVVYGQSTADLIQEGIRAFEAGDFLQAQSYFSIAVKEAPSATSLNYLAIAEARLGQLDPAINHFRQSIRAGNNSAKVHYDLGLAYADQGRLPAAIPEFYQAIALDPNHTQARYHLAVALLKTGRSRQAITELTELLVENPRAPQFWVSLVGAQFEAGTAGDVMKNIDKAVEVLPTDVHLISALAALCSTHHQLQRACLLLEDASELMPQNPEIKLLLARASLRAGEPIEVLAVLQGIASNQGKAGEISTMRGMALAYTGKLEAAAEEVSAALLADPQNPKYLVASAWIDQLEGHHEQALSVLDKARKLDPSTPVIPYRIAVSYFFLLRYTLSVQEC